jgi:hypothetical protein
VEDPPIEACPAVPRQRIRSQSLRPRRSAVYPLQLRRGPRSQRQSQDDQAPVAAPLAVLV